MANVGHSGADRVEGRPLYRQSVEAALEDRLGSSGLPRASLDSALKRLVPALADLKESYRTGSLAHLRVPEDRDDIITARAALDRLCAGARTLVFFGIGGSSLGGQTIAQLAGWNIPGTALEGQSGRPRTRFYDNLDGTTLTGALDMLDLATTRFVVISKSGRTPETLVQAAVALQAVDAAGLGARAGELFLGLTEPARAGTANPLRTLLEGRGATVLDHHPGIGGRFSCLTNVGLLPGMARGLDPFALRAGARSVVDTLLGANDPADCPPAVGAALAVALAQERGVRSLVLMPYVDRLKSLGHWWVQLWAESLGKNGLGTTPVACLGPVDQHSQLQLFMDGPREHLMTVIRLATSGSGPLLSPEMAKAAGVPEMAGRHVGDLVEAQAHAVPEALGRAGRPVRSIDIDVLDERTLGALLMHFMLETMFAARLLGVDAFDQPAVELAKELTRERLAEQNSTASG
jgi:glucose-6-phosphate isomerase